MGLAYKSLALQILRALTQKGTTGDNWVLNLRLGCCLCRLSNHQISLVLALCQILLLRGRALERLCKEELLGLLEECLFVLFMGPLLLHDCVVSKNWVARQVVAHDHLVELQLDCFGQFFILTYALRGCCGL